MATLTTPASACYLCDRLPGTNFLCSDCQLAMEDAISQEQQGNPQPVITLLDKMTDRLQRAGQQYRVAVQAAGWKIDAS